MRTEWTQWAELPHPVGGSTGILVPRGLLKNTELADIERFTDQSGSMRALVGWLLGVPSSLLFVILLLR